MTRRDMKEKHADEKGSDGANVRNALSIIERFVSLINSTNEQERKAAVGEVKNLIEGSDFSPETKFDVLKTVMTIQEVSINAREFAEKEQEQKEKARKQRRKRSVVNSVVAIMILATAWLAIDRGCGEIAYPLAIIAGALWAPEILAFERFRKAGEGKEATKP